MFLYIVFNLKYFMLIMPNISVLSDFSLYDFGLFSIVV